MSSTHFVPSNRSFRSITFPKNGCVTNAVLHATHENERKSISRFNCVRTLCVADERRSFIPSIAQHEWCCVAFASIICWIHPTDCESIGSPVSECCATLSRLFFSIYRIHSITWIVRMHAGPDRCESFVSFSNLRDYTIWRCVERRSCLVYYGTRMTPKSSDKYCNFWRYNGPSCHSLSLTRSLTPGHRLCSNEWIIAIRKCLIDKRSHSPATTTAASK